MADPMEVGVSLYMVIIKLPLCISRPSRVSTPLCHYLVSPKKLSADAGSGDDDDLLARALMVHTKMRGCFWYSNPSSCRPRCTLLQLISKVWSL